MPIKLITLNIEGDKHLQRFLPVLKALQPDIVCFQELFQVDIELIASTLGLNYQAYVPTMTIEKENNHGINQRGNWGVGLMTKLKVKSCEYFYYREMKELKVFQAPNDAVPAVIIATISDGQKEYRVATTHFTWSPSGETTDLQRQDFEHLKNILSKYEDIVLCGDFNAPRGREIFSLFEQRFADNVPKDIETTIDNSLHYAGHKNLQLVVDSIFSTPSYKIDNVKILSGVSDHMGIYSEVSA